MRGIAVFVLAFALFTIATSAEGLQPQTASLKIVVWPNGPGGPKKSFTLACPSGAGTLPRPGRACARLARTSRDAFRPVPKNAICTEIYGGAQEALVKGTLRGRRVTARFSRQNGCNIARWDRLAFLFPIRVGV